MTVSRRGITSPHRTMKRAAAPRRPNIVFITTHDSGRHLGCYGVTTVHSPHLDALAAQGVRFTNCFATSALCSPSRGALMTGRYPQSNGMLGLCHEPYAWAFNKGEKHLSRLLHDAGYYTILLGHQHEVAPTGPGNEFVCAPELKQPLCFDRQDKFRYPGTWQHVECDEVAAAAEAFVRGDAARRAPFFLQLGFFENHRPHDFGGAKPDDERGIFVPPLLIDNDAARDEFASFQGNIRKGDAAIGRVLAALRAAGLERDTLVLYTADHGIPFPRMKTTLYDGGIQVALIMRWPGGGITGGRHNSWLLSNVDVVPTLLDLIRVKLPANLDGLSFARAFKGRAKPVRDHIFAEQLAHTGTCDSRCVRTERHKLIRNFSVGQMYDIPINVALERYKGTRPLIEVYDLTHDPMEMTNLADEPACARVRAQLDAALWRWLEEVNDPILKGPVRTPAYERAIAGYHAFKKQR